VFPENLLILLETRSKAGVPREAEVATTLATENNEIELRKKTLTS
jgi:hypothetical protein